MTVYQVTSKNTYCREQSILYNLVSNIDKHTAGIQPPVTCIPQAGDFEHYIHFLKKNYNKTEMALIATYLYDGSRLSTKSESTKLTT